jgi:hypothetical protein
MSSPPSVINVSVPAQAGSSSTNSPVSPPAAPPSGGTADLEIDLNGSRSAPINIGASGLPAGVSVAGTPVIDFYYGTDGSYTLSYGTAPSLEKTAAQASEHPTR